ncbi:MAG: hypothetical protein JSV58_05440 [Candidatus Bathyarchaeota archaeon]|nr:MAG: hypothetical protein JSV58_05440 [Candidatus Bathyarchaeota archaeon]
MFDEITWQTIGPLLFVGCPFLILYLLLKAESKTSSAMMPRKRRRIVSYRWYWKNPGLIPRLSREQRIKVERKFFESVEKGRRKTKNERVRVH